MRGRGGGGLTSGSCARSGSGDEVAWVGVDAAATERWRVGREGSAGGGRCAWSAAPVPSLRPLAD
jgi:hypothetical protein